MHDAPTFATAQTIADLSKRDPRSIKAEFKPVAYLETPNGRKALYLLAEALGDAVRKYEQE